MLPNKSYSNMTFYHLIHSSTKCKCTVSLFQCELITVMVLEQTQRQRIHVSMFQFISRDKPTYSQSGFVLTSFQNVLGK